MSRLGRKPILIPAGVTVTVNGINVVVKGPKGTLSVDVRPEVSVKVEGGSILIGEKEHTKEISAYIGLTWSLINNMIKGVVSGFEKKLELVGVGFRAKKNAADNLGLTLGFSHPVEFKMPAGIEFDVPENQIVLLRGIDKQLVGQVAANIRKLRKPEPYKGKGIRYSGEAVRRKQGKSGKV